MAGIYAHRFYIKTHLPLTGNQVVAETFYISLSSSTIEKHLILLGGQMEGL